MRPQDPPAPVGGATQFAQLVDQALGEHVRYKQTHTYAFDIGIRALELLRTGATGQLHSRKLRSFLEVAFQ